MMFKLFYIFLLYWGVLEVTNGREIPSPPKIVKQPPTDEVLFQVQTTDIDKPFYIECEAAGDPQPTYRWVKNGKPFVYQTYDNRILQLAGRGTLTITKPNDEDLGQYQCFAENEYGIATSNSVFMRKAELNNFKNTQPMLVIGNEGDPFKLECQPPDGWPKPVVYWIITYNAEAFKSINNSRMTLDPEGNLWFSNLTKQDETDNFMYACAASSMTRLEYKIGNRVKVQVKSSGVSTEHNKHPPIRQYVSRKNEVAVRGKSVEMYCIYGGTPLPQTIWSRNGDPIRFNDRITQEKYGKSLLIKSVDFDDEGVYSCYVSNGVGDAQTFSFDLQVAAVPYFTVEPKISNAAEGETVEFQCSASGVPKPDIKWIHNGRPISEAPPNPRRIINQNSIVITNLQKNDTGNYGCNATNSLGYVYKDVYVNVLALAPEIIEAPRDQEAVNGKAVNMTCRVFGVPAPLVKWSRDDKELTGGRYTVLQSADLSISNVQYDDSNTYTCYAENKFGKTSASCKLVVRRHTYITDGPEDYEITAGQEARFRCNAVADEELPLEIIWERQGRPIDFEAEPRFVLTSDSSTVTISQTIELDSGTYTCRAKTRLDEASAQAVLTVQDIPNAPEMHSITCNKLDATITWIPKGDNRSPILNYIIQYNTSFTPDTWEVAHNNVPAVDSSYNVPISPWANYTFRVIAKNKVGLSLPSAHSAVCTTLAQVPYKNPDNVEGEGDQPDNLVIKWSPMPEIDHNAPGFHYLVEYRRDLPDVDFTSVTIDDWTQSKYVVQNQESFKQYRIKVTAVNNEGKANVSPDEVIGYSGENVPTEAPTNFTLNSIQSPTTGLLSWNPVSIDSVRGHFKGYKIKTWTDSKTYREIQAQGDTMKALVSNFVPYSKNYAQVYVYNGKYNGPPSVTLSFDTPEGVPGQMSSLEAYPMGSSAFLLTWQKPDQPNGILNGYKIFYAVVNGTRVDSKMPRIPQISDPEQLQAKLSGLKPNTKYRIYITASTAAGDSKEYFIEQSTKPTDHTAIPLTPNFVWKRVGHEGNKANIKVKWYPNYDRPGSHFFVKYRRRGETSYLATGAELSEDWLIVAGLTPDEQYEFIVVAVDGDYRIESEPQEVDTYGSGPIIQQRENLATAGWFIGMMLAIAFLLLVLIIVCIVKRNRGGKYAVHEREQANGRHDYHDESGFHEYSQPLDNKSHGRTSMTSEPKMEVGSDTDSMAEYGEGDTEGMNEDGSFIGQYGQQRRQEETTSQGFATLV